MRSFLASVIVASVFIGCADTSGPHKEVSAPGKATASSGGTPGFDTVKPLFQKYCSTCHPGKQPSNWLDYSQAKSSASTIKLRVWTMKTAPNQMPQAGSPESAAIPDGDRKTIADWVDAGAPEKSSSAPAAPAPGGATTTVATGKLQACFSCHGENGKGNPAQAIPAIGGQQATYLYNQLVAFQTTLRDDPSGAMNAQMADKTDEEMHAYADELSKLPAFYESAAPVKDPVKYEVGKTMVEACIGCHGSDGIKDGYGERPYLFGQGKVYLMRQLVSFRGKTKRVSPDMSAIASDLTDKDIDALTTYFSQTPLKR